MCHRRRACGAMCYRRRACGAMCHRRRACGAMCYRRRACGAMCYSRQCLAGEEGVSRVYMKSVSGLQKRLLTKITLFTKIRTTDKVGILAV